MTPPRRLLFRNDGWRATAKAAAGWQQRCAAEPRRSTSLAFGNYLYYVRQGKKTQIKFALN
jgi:hypothetical protein